MIQKLKEDEEEQGLNNPNKISETTIYNPYQQKKEDESNSFKFNSNIDMRLKGSYSKEDIKLKKSR